MPLCQLSLWLGLLCLDRQAAVLEQPGDSFAAGQLWEQGQNAIRHGQADHAIHCFEQSLAADPTMVVNHLSLFVAYREKRNFKDANDHLAAYIDAHPEQWSLRVRHAELLVQLRRWSEARAELELFLDRVQEEGGPVTNQWIQCHSQLVEIAEESEDAYGEHLHRGIGLYLLARKRASLPPLDGLLPPQSLLCKAAAELSLAQLQRPEEARPSWYLYVVWSQLGQRQPALCRLRQAQAAAPYTYLTPVEQRSLASAYDSYRSQLRHP